MPTPSESTPQLTTSTLPGEISAHTTCPPEIERGSSRTAASEEHAIDDDIAVNDGAVSPASATAQTAGRRPSDVTSTPIAESSTKKIKSDEDVIMGSMSPDSASSSETKEEQSSPTSQSSSSISAHSAPSTTSSLSYKFSNSRLYPNHTSSFLRSGSKFVGTQQSDRQVYNVDVEIKHVDMAESYLCGYLRIQGLTEDHPTLTTYFEGEIIGTKHTFQTRHESWGANEKTDMLHWARFPAWRPLAKQAKKPDFTYRNFAQREHIFMRWKEYFLVPDHRVRTISGASFEGFYYICFNQVEGTVSTAGAKARRRPRLLPGDRIPLSS
ncbi:Vesicle-mediated transport protein Vid24 [Rasamsonia emersonii CBS 393.64]|uniref:Vesicle-mediated transport protein Vid24 n=1 Tax=Rasamsonia emersonii (strain ATCC 16479 / CBS 393.64 / IMI 116815) TaxID=1408163 RepID=A0A0F4YVU8_RASE3|nr:Vesicle-mediated transport protein Vid24 [Rasamsonia emersonii CBS 393.64]KKA22427.1 Vesicle-mediated transport protein Vid24 [Rasamsonia emersonii CBS 393.64]